MRTGCFWISSASLHGKVQKLRDSLFKKLYSRKKKKKRMWLYHLLLKPHEDQKIFSHAEGIYKRFKVLSHRSQTNHSVSKIVPQPSQQEPKVDYLENICDCRFGLMKWILMKHVRDLKSSWGNYFSRNNASLD